MKGAVVFNGIHALDFEAIRCNVVRIPEVLKRIRDAQKIWDDVDCPQGLELGNFIASDNEVFLNNIRLKSLISAVVQIGLYDRYLRSFGVPECLMGSINGDSALAVAVGLYSFEDMVRNSAAVLNRSSSDNRGEGDVPLVLSGISLVKFAAFERLEVDGRQTFAEVKTDGRDFSTLVVKMIEERRVKRFVNVGPGNLLLKRQGTELELAEVQILESIDIDPMLNWFWPEMKGSTVAAAMAQ